MIAVFLVITIIFILAEKKSINDDVNSHRKSGNDRAEQFRKDYEELKRAEEKEF